MPCLVVASACWLCDETGGIVNIPVKAKLALCHLTCNSWVYCSMPLKQFHSPAPRNLLGLSRFCTALSLALRGGYRTSPLQSLNEFFAMRCDDAPDSDHKPRLSRIPTAQSGYESQQTPRDKDERVTCATRGPRLRQAAELRTRIVCV